MRGGGDALLLEGERIPKRILFFSGAKLGEEEEEERGGKHPFFLFLRYAARGRKEKSFFLSPLHKRDPTERKEGLKKKKRKASYLQGKGEGKDTPFPLYFCVCNAILHHHHPADVIITNGRNEETF